MKTEVLLQRLDKVRQTEKGWQACCPAHDDKAPSLSISNEDGKTLLHCHAGCSTQDVVAALGINLADLFEDNGEDKKSTRKKKQARHEGLNYEVLCLPDPENPGKYNEKKIALPYNKVMDKLIRIVKDNMATVDGIVFAIPHERGDKIDFLERPADFFGQLGIQSKSAPDWTKHLSRAMTQGEAYSRIKQHLTAYRGVESAPHCPSMRGIYYNHPELPPMDEVDEPMMDYFLNQFCPETPEDKALILALFLTSVWGGTESQRPAFVISSPDGRGSGKSSLGEMAAALLNQDPISGSTKGDMEELLKRILSPIGMTSRIVLFDNEVGRVSSGQLAGLITTRTISGKRMYHGEGRRPNNILWVITLNTPTLDSDLASRCIPVSVVRPKQTIAGWKSNVIETLDQWRWELIAMLIHMLLQPTDPIRTRTRWATWEQDVLSKIPEKYGNITDIQALIVNRQREFDDEADEIALIHDGFEGLIRHGGYDPNDAYPCFIPNSKAADVYIIATGSRARKNTALRELKNMAKEQIKELQEYRHYQYGRGFLWLSNIAVGGDENIRVIKNDLF